MSEPMYESGFDWDFGVEMSDHISGQGSCWEESQEGTTRVRLARFGFVADPLGECSWTARDLL